MEINLAKLKCLRCGYEWHPRKNKAPKQCPHCHNIYWNKKRVYYLGENHPNWKGDDVSYGGLHDYIKRYLPKTKLCQNCELVPPYDLANISQEYKRDLSDWEWLCRRCHMKKDGRDQALPNRTRGVKLSEERKREISRTSRKLGSKPPSPLGRKLSDITKKRMAKARAIWWEKYYRGEVLSKRYKNKSPLRTVESKKNNK